jgi:hypothetical protein
LHNGTHDSSLSKRDVARILFLQKFVSGLVLNSLRGNWPLQRYGLRRSFRKRLPKKQGHCHLSNATMYVENNRAGRGHFRARQCWLSLLRGSRKNASDLPQVAGFASWLGTPRPEFQVKICQQLVGGTQGFDRMSPAIPNGTLCHKKPSTGVAANEAMLGIPDKEIPKK